MQVIVTGMNLFVAKCPRDHADKLQARTGLPEAYGLHDANPASLECATYRKIGVDLNQLALPALIRFRFALGRICPKGGCVKGLAESRFDQINVKDYQVSLVCATRPAVPKPIRTISASSR